MLNDLKTNRNIFIVAAALILSVFSVENTEAAGCGAGCQRSMGSCTVNSSLWASLSAARESGVRATSCCRSKEYNTRMRSCGYFPSPSSAHMSGNAVDLIVSPARCNSRNLAQYGFSNVCPHYHYGHCHVQQCGTPRTARAARERVPSRAARIRRDNYRRPMTMRPKPQSYRRAYRPDREPMEQEYYFDAQPTWWEIIEAGVEQ